MENISPQSSSSHEAEISRVEEAKPFLSSEDLQKPKVNQQLEMDSEMQPSEESQARHVAQMLRQESSEGIKVSRNDLELQTLALPMEGKGTSDLDAIETSSNQADNGSKSVQKSCMVKFIVVEVLIFFALSLFMPSFDVYSDCQFIVQLWNIMPTYGIIALGILAIPSIVALFLALTNLRHIGNKKRRFMVLKSNLIGWK